MARTFHAGVNGGKPTEHDKTVLMMLLIVVAMCVAFVFVKDALYFGDEGFHDEQIKYFLDGRYDVTSSLTTIPGYHALMAVAGKVMGEQSLAFFRFMNLLISLASVVGFLATARAISRRATLAKTVQYVFLPILFPFFFLLYTDVLSLLFVILAVYAHERSKWSAAALFGIASVVTRQNNIVWFTFLFMGFLCDTGRVRHIVSLLPQRWHGRCMSVLPSVREEDASPCALVAYIAGFVLFAVFIGINGGIAIGDKGAHPFPSFHLGNIYFLLFLVGILFLPLHIANLKNIGRYLWTNRYAPAVLVAFFVFGMLTFMNTHGYNQGMESVFLRNRILSYATLTPLLKTAFFIPTTLAFLSLLVTKLQKPAYYALYPLTILYLLPSWLIEQRYYFIPLVLFLLFRKDDGKIIEGISAFYSIILCAMLFWMTAARWTFL